MLLLLFAAAAALLLSTLLRSIARAVRDRIRCRPTTAAMSDKIIQPTMAWNRDISNYNINGSNQYQQSQQYDQ